MHRMSTPNGNRRLLAAESGPSRELTLFLGALAFGLIIVPWLIWLAGEATLGDYVNGGPFALWGDFFRGLLAGSLGYWVAALGPYVLLLAARALLRLWRRPTDAEGD